MAIVDKPAVLAVMVMVIGAGLAAVVVVVVVVVLTWLYRAPPANTMKMPIPLTQLIGVLKITVAITIIITCHEHLAACEGYCV